jgi:formylglycine-generating enzyme required for sulfatase activity
MMLKKAILTKKLAVVVGLILFSGGAIADKLPFEPEMVQLPNDLWMGKYEVTQGQWQAVMGNNPSKFKKYCGENCPVEKVSWDDVQQFISRLNQKTGKNYRLPTEEEWFSACQAGQNYNYSGSDNADDVAWYMGNSKAIEDRETRPVGQKTANAWGLHDMSGNVGEWTSSYYDSSKVGRVVLGGAFNTDVGSVRCAASIVLSPDNRSRDVGFRVILSPSL